MFKFLTPYLWYIVGGILAILLGTIAWLYVEKEHYKSINETLIAQIEEARKDNVENVKTIDELKISAGKTGTLYASCMRDKSELAKKLISIGNLKEGGISNEGDTLSSGNPLLDALNGMYPEAGHAGGVCKADDAGAAAGGAGQPGEFLYCLHRQDAINLLYNKTLHDGREADMEKILETFQTITTGN